MNVEITGVAEEVIKEIISSGDASSPEEAIEIMAVRVRIDGQISIRPNDPRIEAMIEEGLASGIGSEITPDYWKKIKEDLVKRHAEGEDVRRGA